MTTYLITLPANHQVELAVEEYGSGQPFLLLHGGAGPQSMTGFAQRLATSEAAQVIVPTHPGFGGTNRPDWVNTMGTLAQIYVALIERLDLHNVVVVGSSMGGWIAAEMALLNSPRIRNFVLMDAVGIAVEGQSIADVFSLTMDELASLSYHNPTAFRIDMSALTDVQKRLMAANRQALAVYGGQPSMIDPTLASRLSAVTTPTLVLWGASDRVVTPDYGRAFAAAIPTATFQLLSNVGHLPQIEAPDQVLTTLREYMSAQPVTRPDR